MFARTSPNRYEQCSPMFAMFAIVSEQALNKLSENNAAEISDQAAPLREKHFPGAGKNWRFIFRALRKLLCR